MNEARWERLLAYLRRASSSQIVDSHERAQRLEVATELRRILKLASEGAPWLEPLVALASGPVPGRPHDLVLRLHTRWLERLASPETLGLALECFLDAEQDPVERFSSFVRAAAVERPALLAPPELLGNPDIGRDDPVLAMGSLFNFASAPEDLPVIRPAVFDLLEQTLGYEWTYRISIVEQYKRHLAFAEDVKNQLQEAGVPVRDMLDAQGLIQIAGLQADFWAARGQDLPPGDGGRTKPYLSICAIYRDEAPYLREWIEFHRLVGVERFFLYDNLSEDDHLEVLAPYLEDGTVTIQRWPVFDPQVPAYNDCLRWHRDDSRWIAFIDVDEFLFSPSGQPLPDVLADYEAWPGVAVAWAMFGTGGHRTRPPGLVIESYLRRVEQPDPIMNMKSVVDPLRVIRFLSAHHCGYPYLSAVDENHVPVERHTLIPRSFARLRLNHYHFKSEEEYVAKFERWRAIGRRRHIPTEQDLERVRKDEDENGVTDETILMYLPALREALVAHEQARPVATQQR
jgi:hypothetical protein